jgi:UDP-N-acetylglucosamine--N-acetylmuramyl-(pentapeptide) pyrophosphoryl-undecaprenol N-acetylglucosamine transferase
LEPRIQPFFVGALRGIEKDVLPTTEFEYALLDLHPLYRSKPWRNWKTAVGAARSWGRLTQLIRRLEPCVVLGTGGYAAGLTLAAASLAGIPLALQEANSYPGLTMRIFSRRAREIYLGFPEAASLFRRGRSTVVLNTGNPIEPPPQPRTMRSVALARCGFPADAARVLLVVGGSQGARPINAAAAEVVNSLGDDGTYVIWATGSAHYGEFSHLSSARVKVVPYLSPIADAYAVADFALCRAGASTTSELSAWGIPSLLVPLPTAAADHQTANARALEKAGGAIVMLQSELGGGALLQRLREVVSKPEVLARMSEAALKRAMPNAAELIASRLVKMCDIT